jgi:diguanylate cyclase (GGDEF)-like protein
VPESSLTNELLVLEHDVLKAIATGRSLPDAMTIICRRVEEMLPGVACSVLAVDRGTLRPLAGPSLPEAFNRAVDGYPIGPAAGSCGTAAYLGVEVDVADILTDPRWEDAREFVAGLGYTSCWSSPILARNGDTLGTFAFYYRERNGSRNVERDIVDSCVPLCAIAMEHERAQDTVRRLAYRDTLTQLGNRTAFFERARRLVADCGDGEYLAMVYVDLDGFKEINDTFGHWTGDQVLVGVGDRLRALDDGRGHVARLGGDEFALVRIGSDPDEMAILAARLIASFETPFEVEGQTATLTASAGVAFRQAGDDDFTGLMKNADLALYRAKAEGGSRYCFFTPDMALAARRRRELENDLRKALDRGEFFLVYQPIVDLATGVTRGCEALVRWRQPTVGLRLPAEFISLAEELGLIAPIGAWVLEEACREAAAWPDDIYVAVNLSAIQLRNPGFCEEVRGALARTGLPARRLQIEITESVLLAESQATARALAALREMGIAIALDDFGTGYSSLRSVRAFRPDKIKIDGSFVQDLEDNEQSRKIVVAVIAMARSLDLVTTAEGIETTAQADLVKADGCLEGQGFLFSRPRPADDIRRLLGQGGKHAPPLRAAG